MRPFVLSAFRGSLPLVVAATVACSATPAAAAARVPWPLPRLELGLTSQPGTARTIARDHGVKLRYQYLAGGVNTSAVWTTWGDHFVEDYVIESRAAKLVPVFTYYEMRQSEPGGSNGDEPAAVLGNLASPAVMRAYFANVRELFTRLATAGGPVVVHVEPDLWGYVQQRVGDDAARAPAAVASSGAAGVEGLPNTAAGFAQAFVKLRDELAPNVVLGYHVSVWGTDRDIAISDDGPAAVDALARRSAAFYASLGAPFDVTFGEFSDRDSGMAVAYGAPTRTAWWDAADFRRHVRFVGGVHRATGLPVVLWQIPVGNTVMRSMDDTPGHYQDNRPQWLLSGANGWAHLRAYRDAGVVALLFGGGQGDDTSVLDARKDGTTNPAPTNGNRRRARVADDDGGYFRERSRAYRRRGALKLLGP
ncbi:MAG: hypothetical protein PGN13_12925 [Patulibacter minatonensis]